LYYIYLVGGLVLIKKLFTDENVATEVKKNHQQSLVNTRFLEVSSVFKRKKFPFSSNPNTK